MSALLQHAMRTAAASEADPVRRAAMMAAAQRPFGGKKLVMAGNALQMPKIQKRIVGKYASGDLITDEIDRRGYWEAAPLQGLRTRKVRTMLVWLQP